jgi:hypothetical protein
VSQQPSKALLALNVAAGECGKRRVRTRCRPIAQSLMRSFQVKMRQKLTQQLAQMRLTEYDEVVEALLLHRLHPPFRDGVEVRRLRPNLLHAHSVLPQNSIEAALELGVMIA